MTEEYEKLFTEIEELKKKWDETLPPRKGFKRELRLKNIIDGKAYFETYYMPND